MQSVGKLDDDNSDIRRHRKEHFSQVFCLDFNLVRRIIQLRQLCDRKNPHCLIEVDGGVNLQNAPLLYEAGADVLVAGNAVFKSDNPIQTIHQLKQ